MRYTADKPEYKTIKSCAYEIVAIATIWIISLLIRRFTTPPSDAAERKYAPLTLTPVTPAAFTWF